MFSQMKLGCLPKKTDKRTLRLAKYLQSPNVPTPPASVDWRDKVQSWPMYLNNHIGCCTIASVAHQEQLWSNADGAPVLPTDNDVLTAYSAVSGYNPQTGANDHGAVLLDVQNYWRNTGVAGNKLGGYAEANIQDHRLIAVGVYLFGAMSVGVQLPLAWQGSDVWDVPGRHHLFRFWNRWAPGSWGGHAVPVVSYDQQYLYVVSWGQIVKVTWPAWDQYFVEAYANFDSLWTGGDGKAPNGFDVPALTADLQSLGAN